MTHSLHSALGITPPRRVSRSEEIAATLRLAWPIVGAQLFLFGMLFANSVIMGHLGRLELATVGIGGTFYGLLFTFSIGVLSAVSPGISHAHGAGDHRLIARWYRQGLAVAAILTLVTTLIVILWAEDLLRLTGQADEIIPRAREFLLVLLLGVPAQLGFGTNRMLCEATGNSRPSILFAALGLSVNVPVTWVLAHGSPFLPPLGPVSAALGLALANWSMFLASSLYIRRCAALRPIRFFGREPFIHRATFFEIWRLGLPLSGAIMGEMLFFASSTFFMGTMGSQALAAHQIALNAASMTFMIPLGLSFAVSIRVGHHLGAGNPDDARSAGVTGFLLISLIQILPCALFLLAPHEITRLYTADPDLITSASSLLIVAGFFQLFDGQNVVAVGTLRGYKDTTVPFLMTLVSYWIIGVLTGTLAIRFHWFPTDMLAVWWALLVGLACGTALNWTRFWWITHQRASLNTNFQVTGVS